MLSLRLDKDTPKYWLHTTLSSAVLVYENVLVYVVLAKSRLVLFI